MHHSTAGLTNLLQGTAIYLAPEAVLGRAGRGKYDAKVGGWALAQCSCGLLVRREGGRLRSAQCQGERECAANVGICIYLCQPQR